jgi:hypothetical protein
MEGGIMDTKRFCCFTYDVDHFFANGTEQAPMRDCHFIVAQFELVMCTSLVSTCFVFYRSLDELRS